MTAGDLAPPIPNERVIRCTITAMNPLSGVLGEAWRMYKAYAMHLLAIAFVIYLVAAVIAALLALAGNVGVALGALVQIIAAFLLQATLVYYRLAGESQAPPPASEGYGDHQQTAL